MCVCVHKVPYIKINSLQMTDCELSVHCSHAVIWVAWYMCMRLYVEINSLHMQRLLCIHACMYIHVLKVPYMSIIWWAVCFKIQILHFRSDHNTFIQDVQFSFKMCNFHSRAFKIIHSRFKILMDA